MKIIFKNKDNSIGIITPTAEVLSFATILQVAEKDVAKDLPYWVVEDTEVPSDRTFRNAWTMDESIAPDGFGGESNEFDDELLAKYKANERMTSEDIEYWNNQTSELIVKNLKEVIK